MIKHRKCCNSLSAGFRLTIIFLMLLCGDFSFSQIKIKEKIVISPSKQPMHSINESNDTTYGNATSSNATIITATFEYHACTGNATIVVNGPCNSYNESVTGNSVFGYGDRGIAQVTMIAYDEGSYSFGVINNLNCPTNSDSFSICGGWPQGNCRWSTTISDNKGWSNTIPGPGAGGAYFNSSSTVCTVEGVQPQTLDTTSFEVYKQGDLFFDPSLSQPIVVNNCGYKVKPGTIRFGYTIPPWQVNLAKDTPYYDVVKNIKDINKNPTVCIDNTNPADLRWNFQFKTRVRIPIFSSVCPPSGFKNLGGDSIAWQTKITSCELYEKAEYAMRTYWVPGSYVSGSGIPPDSIYFDSMVMAHEETHLEDWKRAIRDTMNKEYYNAFQNRPHTDIFPCAKSAFDSKPEPGYRIPIAYQDATEDKGESEHEKLLKEIATDKDPRTKNRRQVIYDQFKTWGRSKGWVDQNDNVNCP
jgi:hypothetical protein